MKCGCTNKDCPAICPAYEASIANAQYTERIVKFRCSNIFVRIWYAIIGDIPL